MSCIRKVLIAFVIIFCAVPCMCRRRRYRRGDDCHEDVISMYEVSFFGDWSRKTFPKMYPRYRPNAQWSKLVGRTHDATYTLWREGELASPTLQKFVEEGNSLMLEKDAQGFNGTMDTFTAAPVRSGVGRTSVRIMANGKYSKISFVVKLIPSPDWFVGIDSIELCRAGRWRRRIHMTMRPLDGGTDKGLTYTSPNWPTHPQEPVYHILPTKPRHPASPFYNPKVTKLPRIAHVLIERIGEFARVGKRKSSKFQNATNTYVATEAPIGTPTTTLSAAFLKRHYNDGGAYRKDSSDTKNTEIVPPGIAQVTDRNRADNSYTKTTDSAEEMDTQTPSLLTQNDDSAISSEQYIDSQDTTEININSADLTTDPLAYDIKHANEQMTKTKRNHWRSTSTERLDTDDYIKSVRSSQVRRYSSRNATSHKSQGRNDYVELTEPTVPDYKSRSLFRDQYGQQRGILFSSEQEVETNEANVYKNNGAITDCLVTAWGAWGPCSKTCGFGIRMRKRQILQQTENGGSACPRVSLEALCGSMATCKWNHFSMFAKKSESTIRRRRRRHHRVKHRSRNYRY